MIRPRLPKLPSGTRLTTDLVNGIINRTEYAADLLRQYKLTAGNQMYVEPHYDGTRVSYLQPVAGGATPLQPIEQNFSVIGTNGAIYLSPNFNKTDQLIGDDFGVTAGSPILYGIRGKFALGIGQISGNDYAGLVYNGIDNGLANGGGFNTRYPGSESTEFWDIDPTNNNIVVGSYYSPPDYDYNGLIYNISTGQFSTLNRLGQDSTGTYLTGIYNGIIIGGQAFGTQDNFYYNGSFNSLPDGFFPYGIYENKIVGNDGLIYEIGIGFTRQIAIPELGSTFLSGIYKNYVVGQRESFPFTSFVYNLDDNTYITINDRCWAIG